ncbi:MAG: hypothetical protein ACP5K9_01520 [Candidatus Micrarchaeia archaeon]
MSFYGLVIVATIAVALSYTAWLGSALQQSMAISSYAERSAAAVRLESLANVAYSQNLTVGEVDYISRLEGMTFNNTGGVVEIGDGNVYVILKLRR